MKCFSIFILIMNSTKKIAKYNSYRDITTNIIEVIYYDLAQY